MTIAELEAKGYVLATDDDFSGNYKYGFLYYEKYVGNDLKVIVPEYIKGELVTSCIYMFEETNVEAVALLHDNVTNMGSMFENSNATTLDLAYLNTSNVEGSGMDLMFYGAKATTIDVSNFNTSKLTRMYMMFSYAKIKNLDISNFDMSNIKYVYGMLLLNAKKIYLGSFNVPNNLDGYDDLFSDIDNRQIYFTESQAVISTRTGYPWGVNPNSFVFNYTPPVPGAGYDLKVRVGSSWVKKNYKIWDGTKWSEDLPLKIRHNNDWLDIYKPELQNIAIGDNLSSKKLVLTCDEDEPFYWFTWLSEPAVIKCGESNYIEFEQSSASGIDGFIKIVYNDVELDYICFIGNWGVMNYTPYTLPSDFGAVTSIEIGDPSYAYLKIYK